MSFEKFIFFQCCKAKGYLAVQLMILFYIFLVMKPMIPRNSDSVILYLTMPYSFKPYILSRSGNAAVDWASQAAQWASRRQDNVKSKNPAASPANPSRRSYQPSPRSYPNPSPKSFSGRSPKRYSDPSPSPYPEPSPMSISSTPAHSMGGDATPLFDET